MTARRALLIGIAVVLAVRAGAATGQAAGPDAVLVYVKSVRERFHYSRCSQEHAASQHLNRLPPKDEPRTI